ncbi:hypothetical protein QNH10_12610 [Sporosarcina thermotolerans]|nr:RecQ family zinc-binding domain-containing protein [Sporosarcina thermotolerans]WHT47120.1 hypothetical protein QNH10_12610 [Sporosarcina thermotolerans]
MLNLVHSDKCLRETVLSYFGERCKEKPQACCSTCGLKEMEWLTEKTNKKNMSVKVTWDDRITNLLG